MNKTIEQITAEIDATIAARKEQLPTIQAERKRIQHQIANLGSLVEQAEKLSAIAGEQADEVSSAVNALKAHKLKLQGYGESLGELEAEFTRDTLNIGVSGAARTGKSTTLQRVTGLNDSQIPSGGKYPVTAVRSEIYNSARNVAVVSFKTERDFIEGYVSAHVANVNECLPEGSKLSIGSVAALKAAKLPEKLEGTVVVGATDSLKRLQEAKRSASTYERYLGSSPIEVSLDDVRSYVTYPAPGIEQSELSGTAADRRYLAVELAQVYCQFPNLGGARVALIDLPGLGEIGDSASQIHLKGLEDKVDQIFLVMRPTAAKAFVDDKVARNLDELAVIQPAVRRGDLVIAGINIDNEAGQEAAEALRAHFASEVNAGRADGGYAIVDYSAVDDESVAGMFAGLLDRLGTLLPRMDEQKVSYCMGAVDVSTQVKSAADELVRAMDRIMRNIPSTDRVMKQRIDAIERAIIGELNAYAFELSKAAETDSDVFRAFIADAERIHGEVSKSVENGLFRKNAEEWSELTSSSKDYYNLYRDEAKRVRYEIIDAYCGLDRFYGVHVSNFKLRVLDTVLRSCGMDAFFDFGAEDAADDRIARVASELGSTLHDDDLDNALELLGEVGFDFRSNVFLQIEEHLAELANPAELYTDGVGRWAKTCSKRIDLGGEGDCGEKQAKMREFLVEDASKANDAILEALKGERDRFNRYLAVSIDFFNNCLFGKDEDNFKQVVIRGLITNYKPWVLPDADDASKSPVGQLAAAVKESALAVKTGQASSNVVIKTDRKREAALSNRSTAVERAKGFSVGQVLRGTVNRVEGHGAFVTIGDHYGWVPKAQISREWVNDARDYLKKCQKVRVKVTEVNLKKGDIKLSIKQAS